MRFVEPKSPQQQARAMVFRTRELFVRQRTQTINALRAHLAEHGLIAPQGMSNLANIRRLIDEAAAEVEPLVVETAHTYLEQIDDLSSRILKLEATLKQEAARTDASLRLMTMPGVGPITAMAIEAFAPSLSVFKRSRDFAAWLGWCHDNILLAANRSWAERRRWGNGISGDYLSSARCQLFGGQPAKEQPQGLGYIPFSSVSPARWRRSHWPTRWLERCGRWKRKRKSTEIHV